ncbi:hypothetical protein NQ315_003304 [Exocentrus adspersus]|uniref:Chromo domain-containing protein n=1 Tax=Exocentrus adspersus TaxID=1586481 RepID=A0AAV8VA44_9CUCU|nr:hypothetical protein NQ315_003304 [Exocentrus adspersus]
MSGIIISDTKRQVVNELHKAARKNFRRRRTIIKGFADLWQIDLAEMQQFASCNRGFRVHRTTGMKPAEVKPTTVLNVYNYPKVALKPKFHPGDVVRISKFKGVFEKGYTANYSTELFKIAKVNVTNPVTYLLEDMSNHPIKGCFYESELQRSKHPDVYLVEKILKKKGNKLFIKWLGLPTHQNSWIKTSDIV